MLWYINACEVANILYLDTKCCIQEDTTKTHILVKFEEKYFMSYQQKHVFTKEAINGKILKS